MVQRGFVNGVITCQSLTIKLVSLTPGRRKIQDETLWIPVTRIPVLRLEERILCLYFRVGF